MRSECRVGTGDAVRSRATWLSRSLLMVACALMLTVGCGDDSGSGHTPLPDAGQSDGAIAGDGGQASDAKADSSSGNIDAASDGAVKDAAAVNDAADTIDASDQDGGQTDADLGTDATVTDAQADAFVSDAGSDAAAPTLTSITLAPVNPMLAVGTTLQLVATGLYSDNSTRDLTTSAQWSSSAPSKATIGASTGLAAAVAAGSSTLTATVGSVVGTTTLTVSSATLSSIAVSPAAPSIAAGTKQQFTAIGTLSDSTTQDVTADVTWTSSATATSTINAAGLASGLTAGDSTISATFGGKTGSAQLTVTSATLTAVTVTPAVPTIAKGTTKQFVATGTYSDGSSQDLTLEVAWTSSTPAVAAISTSPGSQGLATGLTPGTTTIGASFGGSSGSTTLTVTASMLASISVTPANPTLAKGTSQAFIATGVYADNTTQDLTASVTWSSSDPTVATVSNAAATHGVASALAAGHVTISATLGAVVGTTGLTVTQATLSSIAITPLDATLAKNSTLQYTAVGTYSDSSTQDITSLVTWASSDTAVATIANGFNRRGAATSIAAGQTNITATRGGVMGSAVLHVSNATLASIAVTPATPTSARGTTIQFKAVATYSDASTQDVTDSVTWSSSSTNVAIVSNTAGSKGLATTVMNGTTNVRAAFNGVSGTTALTVTGATLMSITVTPDNPSFALGHTQQFTATGTYSDSSTQNLTTQVTWFSTNQGVAVISNTQGSRGLASAVSTGMTTIRAVGPGAITGTTTATVAP